jgi:hypothetical protein
MVSTQPPLHSKSQSEQDFRSTRGSVGQYHMYYFTAELHVSARYASTLRQQRGIVLANQTSIRECRFRRG